MHRSVSLVASCFLFVVMAVGSSHAAIVVDQSQLLNTTAFLQVTQSGGQTFVPAFNNVAGARIALANNAVADTVTVSLHDMIGTSGTVLATSTVTGPFNGASFVEVLFSAPVFVTPGNELFLVFTGTSPAANQSTSFFGANNGNPYASGLAYSSASQSSETPFPTWDFAFETLYDDTLTAVPEPSSGAALMLLLGFAAGRRKRS